MAQISSASLPWTRRLTLFIQSRRTALILGGISIAVGILLWQTISLRVNAGIIFPTFTQTVERLLQLITTEDRVYGNLIDHTRISLIRVFIGFTIGSIIGLLVGLLAGWFAIIRTLIQPHINFFRFITPIAWISPAIIWFGIGETSKIFLIVYTTIFIVLVNTMAGVTHIKRNRVHMAESFGANSYQIFTLIVFPSAIPFILTGMRIAMGNSFATIVAAELIAAREGIGYLIFFSRAYLATDVMFSGLFTLGVLGVAADRIFVLITNRVFGRYLSE